ncbi:LCP family protein [Dehalobacter sp. DCM]|uniref:LCP family protein n=1 Tax=Dehalobacter sp. DCM TaxID=2907827 RepID=UPI003081475D|nr:LCP family protein [Dehalobacter sp. DCM]
MVSTNATNKDSRTKRPKKKSKVKRTFIIIALVIVGVLLGSAAFATFYLRSDTLPGGDTLNKRVSFLLIGADKRPGATSFNSDSIIVASFDPETKIISLLSIPRDTRVTLSGSDSYCKINAVPMLRDIDELKKQVTELTGIKLNGYLLTNFDGFKDIIDTLGGITIDVEKDMYYETGDKQDGVIDLKAGVQELNGTKALQYARFRHDATADIGRTARQQKVLTAVAKEMLKPATVLKLPKLIPQLLEAVETDLTFKDMTRLAGAAKSFEEATIVTQTLPGDAVNLDGLSYWEVNREAAKEVAQNLLLGKTTDKVWDTSVITSMDPDVKAHMTTPTTQTVITMPEILGVTIPEPGAIPVTSIYSEEYTGTVTWSPADSTYVAGTEYTATITLVPKTGYTLKGIAANFFKVPGATTQNAANSGIITAVFPASEPALPEALPIDIGVIAGVTPPTPGAVPATTITETEQYTGAIMWTPADDPFVEGQQYTATVTLFPKEGYTLDSVSENYFSVPGATASNAAGSGVITAIFP